MVYELEDAVDDTLVEENEVVERGARQIHVRVAKSDDGRFAVVTAHRVDDFDEAGKLVDAEADVNDAMNADDWAVAGDCNDQARHCMGHNPSGMRESVSDMRRNSSVVDLVQQG